VTRAIGPSPARAEPHDAAAWLPVPDPHGLPTIAFLLEETVDVDDHDDVIDLAALEAWVSPSPARAEPHDAAAWLPLPEDVHVLPPVSALRDPHPEVQAAVVEEAEAFVREALAAAEAAVAPSPARAEPHDAATWLPLPIVDELAPVETLLEQAPQGTKPRRRGLLRLVPSPRAAGIALLVIATALGVAWTASRLTAPGGSEVSLVVDGTRSQFRTDVKTVGQVLALHHVELGAHDSVVPAAASALHDGVHIDVLRSFRVTVDVDGAVRTVRTTERSAEGLAKQLKLGKLVAVRNQVHRLGPGSQVVYRTRVTGALAVDGQDVRFDSPSRTVGELLESYNVQLLGDDFVVPSLSTVLRDGATVSVVRVGAETIQATQPIPFDTVQQPDPSLPIGQTHEVQAGADGVMTVTYRQRVENGTAGDRTVVSQVPTVAPQPRIIGYGTYADPHWDELAQCESGGRWDTVDSAPAANAYDGGLGIYRGTWRAYGGTEFAPNAGLATREQQIIVGMRIYNDLGWDPWGCANNVLHWPNRTG
jgi:resuscitation-promoting factor RpfB